MITFEIVAGDGVNLTEAFDRIGEGELDQISECLSQTVTKQSRGGVFGAGRGSVLEFEVTFKAEEPDAETKAALIEAIKKIVGPRAHIKLKS